MVAASFRTNRIAWKKFDLPDPLAPTAKRWDRRALALFYRETLIKIFKLKEGNLSPTRYFCIKDVLLIPTYDIYLARKRLGGCLVLVGFKPFDNYLNEKCLAVRIESSREHV